MSVGRASRVTAATSAWSTTGASRPQAAARATATAGARSGTNTDDYLKYFTRKYSVCVQRAVRPADGAVPVRGAAGGGAAVREVRGEHAHPPRRHRPALRALPPVLQPRAGATHNILLYNFSRPSHEISYSSGLILFANCCNYPSFRFTCLFQRNLFRGI